MKDDLNHRDGYLVSEGAKTFIGVLFCVVYEYI
jgi:hypothetical protein